MLLELIFDQKRQSAISEFFKFDRSWNKNEKSDCSDFWKSRRQLEVVFKLNKKLSEFWRITPLGGAKEANFLKIGNFERPYLPHRMSQGHQIFRCPKQLGALVVAKFYFVRFVIGGYCALNLEKSQKNLTLGSPNSI